MIVRKLKGVAIALGVVACLAIVIGLVELILASFSPIIFGVLVIALGAVLVRKLCLPGPD